MPTVTLRYNPAAATPGERFMANPQRVPVRPVDTISFELSPAVDQHRLRITLETETHFAARVVEHAPGQDSSVALQLGGNIPAASFAALRAAFQNAPATHPITHYKCELLNAAGVAVAEAGIGGEIVPDINS